MAETEKRMNYPLRKKCDPFQGVCILCGKENYRVVHKKAAWTYLTCRNCGIVSISPMPSCDQFVHLYKDYLPVKPGEIEKWGRMMRPVVVKSARLIASRFMGKRGKLLDIGSGYGFFLKEMQSYGWEVEGIEISETGRNHAVNRFKIDVHESPLEELSLLSNSYDVVTLFYVIEHLPDPIRIIQEVNRILRPGGMIMLRWPHSTPIVRAIGPLSKALDIYHTPYHIYDFSPRTITRLLKLGGFRDIRTFIGGHTRPHGTIARLASVFLENLGESLCKISGNRILLPGLSKTTTASKGI